MNRAIHSAAPVKCRFCGIHNGIDIELSDVATNDLDLTKCNSERSETSRI